MSLRYSLIPAAVKDAFAEWQRTKAEHGFGFETGVAYGKVLREIDRARLDRDATLDALRGEPAAFWSAR